jgi:hypothetical protein
MIQAKALRIFALLALLLCGVAGLPADVTAQQGGAVPGDSLGLNSDSDLWRFVRTGNAGSTQMKDELAAVMIQSEGDWRFWTVHRNFRARAFLYGPRSYQD